MDRGIFGAMAGKAIAVEVLDPTAADDAGLVDRLTALINRVYADAECGLWAEGATRTTADELAHMIRAGEIAVATRDGAVVGSVRIHDVSTHATEFGLLVSAPEERGSGIGVALLDFAEERSRARGRTAMQLELLVPRHWTHPGKT